MSLSTNRLALAAFILAIMLPASSSALMISVTGGSWSLGTGWGPACTTSACNGEGDTGSGGNKVTGNHTLLNMDWVVDGSLSSASFSLNNVGDVYTLTFGTGTFADEDNQLGNAETNDLGIVGKLNLGVLSEFDNIGLVAATTGTLNDAANDLSLAFDPVNVTLADGTTFVIDFSDPGWNCNPGTQDCSYSNPQTRRISATFTLTGLADTQAGPQNSPVSVPEPGVLLLMGAGLAGLGLARRRKNA